MSHSGVANPINVVNRPLLIPTPICGGWKFTWPADESGFELETTTNLASGNWAPASGSSVLASNQYVQCITPTNAESQVFYRLRFMGP
jgi:hypothetical protein